VPTELVHEGKALLGNLLTLLRLYKLEILVELIVVELDARLARPVGPLLVDSLGDKAAGNANGTESVGSNGVLDDFESRKVVGVRLNLLRVLEFASEQDTRGDVGRSRVDARVLAAVFLQKIPNNIFLVPVFSVLADDADLVHHASEVEDLFVDIVRPVIVLVLLIDLVGEHDDALDVLVVVGNVEDRTGHVLDDRHVDVLEHFSMFGESAELIWAQKESGIVDGIAVVVATVESRVCGARAVV
jgi:hypothetical protein